MPTAQPALSIETLRAAVLEEERQRAREEGLRDGLREAQLRVDEAIRQQVQHLQDRAQAQAQTLQQAHAAELGRMSSIAKHLETALETRLQSVEADAIELAFAAVCQILGDCAATQDTVSTAVRRALLQVTSGKVHRVRLNPADHALLQGGALTAEHPTVEWLPDAAVTPGGCLLESTQGTLDTRLDRQLERLKTLWVGMSDNGRQDR